MALLAQVSTQKLITNTIESYGVSIIDKYGAPTSIATGACAFFTSSSQENYFLALNELITGSISSLGLLYNDGVTPQSGSLYISSLYLGNLGGTTTGQLTTDGTATDLFWKGSKLNDQGGGGGGAIDYVSAFTVSTGALQVSSISSYYIECFGIIGSALYNLGPSNLDLLSLTDTKIETIASTVVSTNAFHLVSSNDARFVIASNAIFDTNVTVSGILTNRVKLVVSTLGSNTMYINETDIATRFILSGSNSPQDVVLPDTSVAGDGWNVKIQQPDSSVNNLSVYDFNSNVLFSVVSGQMYELVTDGTTWYYTYSYEK